MFHADPDKNPDRQATSDFNRYRTEWRFKGHVNSRAQISVEKVEAE